MAGRTAGPRSAVTLRDVAARAAVSTATASRALAGDTAISDPTRERVAEAARALDYRPHAAARSLRRRSTQLLGVLVTTSGDAYAGEVVHGIELRARERGHQVLLAMSHADSTREREAFEVFLYQRVDGIIAVSPIGDGDTMSLPTQLGVPLVIINWDMAVPRKLIVRIAEGPTRGLTASLRSLAPDSGTHVRFDDTMGAEMATEHLRSLGHRRFAFVCGPPARSTRCACSASGGCWSVTACGPSRSCSPTRRSTTARPSSRAARAVPSADRHRGLRRPDGHRRPPRRPPGRLDGAGAAVGGRAGRHRAGRVHGARPYDGGPTHGRAGRALGRRRPRRRTATYVGHPARGQAHRPGHHGGGPPPAPDGGEGEAMTLPSPVVGDSEAAAAPVVAVASSRRRALRRLMPTAASVFLAPVHEGPSCPPCPSPDPLVEIAPARLVAGHHPEDVTDRTGGVPVTAPA